MPEKKPKPKKLTKAQFELRVSEIVAIRLDGAKLWDVRQYVSEKEAEEGSVWQLQEGDKSLVDRQLYRYIEQADKRIAADFVTSRKKRIRQHVAKRQHLYAKANLAGDYRTALAALDSEAKLLGLFAPTKTEVTGKDGSPIYPPLEAMVAAIIKAEQAGGLDDAKNDQSQGDAGNGAAPA
jgi:hypothetical protein